jgi:hypothetical protein
MRQSLSALSDEERAAHLAWAEGVWQREFAYYETGDVLQAANREVQGLGLADGILQKLYHANAAKWYPGLM